MEVTTESNFVPDVYLEHNMSYRNQKEYIQ